MVEKTWLALVFKKFIIKCKRVRLAQKLIGNPPLTNVSYGVGINMPSEWLKSRIDEILDTIPGYEFRMRVFNRNGLFVINDTDKVVVVIIDRIKTVDNTLLLKCNSNGYKVYYYNIKDNDLTSLTKLI